MEVGLAILSTPLTCATPVPDSVARYHTHAVGPNQCCSAAVHHIAAPVSTVWSVVRRFDDPLTSQFATLNDLCYELSSLQDLASRGSWRSILDQVARARKLSLLPKPGGATTTTTSSPPSHHPKWTPSPHRKTNKPETPHMQTLSFFHLGPMEQAFQTLCCIIYRSLFLMSSWIRCIMFFSS
ncbi:hypothetical protein CsSME_00026648 [Camellia sinensis var. sinensis]